MTCDRTSDRTDAVHEARNRTRRRRDGWRPAMDVEDAVSWAVVRQRAAAGPLEPKLLASLLIRGGARGLAGEVVVNGGSWHPDAAWIVAALRRLDAGTAALLLRHAWGGDRPDWTAADRLGPVLVPGAKSLSVVPLVVEGAWLAQASRHVRGGVGLRERRGDVQAVRAVWQHDEGAERAAAASTGGLVATTATWCPLAAVGPGRDTWRAWRAGLAAVARVCAEFRDAGRLAVAVSGPAAPAEPWLGRPDVGEVDGGAGCRLLDDAARRTAFADAVRDGAKPAELAARFGLGLRQARNLKHRHRGAA